MGSSGYGVGIINTRVLSLLCGDEIQCRLWSEA